MVSRYQQILDYLYSFVDYETQHQPRSPVNYDLRRVSELLERLGNPQCSARTVHVAGTKGKGSTAAMITAVLTASGYKTGLFTSPHLIDLRERIRIGKRLISPTDLMRLTRRLKPEVEAVNKRAAYGRLSTFELLTALGFMYFAENKVDFQVIEVGLGGRLDATNVVCPEVSVITNISLDHTDVLGNTISQIAAEKAGIIKNGIPVVSACQPSEARKVIEETCGTNNCQLIEVAKDITYRGLGTQLNGQRVEIRGRLGIYNLELPLIGDFQQANAALAVGAIEILTEKGFAISKEAIAAGFENVRWPGRFQVLRSKPLVVVDGAHNPASACELRKAIELYAPERKPKILVVGSSADKNYREVAMELGPAFDTVIACRTRHPRALSEMKLAEAFREYSKDVQTAPSVIGALETAVGLAGKNGFICASGSLFVVGEALEWAHKRGY